LKHGRFGFRFVKIGVDLSPETHLEVEGVKNRHKLTGPRVTTQAWAASRLGLGG